MGRIVRRVGERILWNHGALALEHSLAAEIKPAIKPRDWTREKLANRGDQLLMIGLSKTAR
ncbi:hypothetical protein YC2023_097085 [Brassica napus]